MLAARHDDDDDDDAIRRKMKTQIWLNCHYKFISAKDIIIFFVSSDEFTQEWMCICVCECVYVCVCVYVYVSICVSVCVKGFLFYVKRNLSYFH